MSKKVKTTIITMVMVILVTMGIMYVARVETTDLESQLEYSWEDGKEVYNADALDELK